MITYKKRYYPENLNTDEIILDIETTGLDASVDNLVLLGLITFEDDKYYLIQYFAEDNDEEKRLLEIYLNRVKDKKIINFNGDKFDIPFLNVRLDKYQLIPIFPETFDIYRAFNAKRKFFTFDSMKLMDLEKHIGIQREDPSRYKVISKLTDEIIRRDKPAPIMKHNENDLIATERLANIEEYFDKKLSIEVKDTIITLKTVWIHNDIAQIILKASDSIEESYFAGSSYELKINEHEIVINLQVLYGRFDYENTGYVAINTFNLKNDSEISVDNNLLIIRENRLNNYKNILNLAKKIIENHL